MSRKRKRCATCGADLANKQYHQVYDYQQGKMVRVCADVYSCKKPFAKVVRQYVATASSSAS